MICFLVKSILISSKIFPVPVTYFILLWIKKGQSLPILFDSDNSSFWLYFGNLLLRNFSIDDPLEDPPPKPAPMGIFLWRWILNFLSQPNISTLLLESPWKLTFDFVKEEIS